MTLHQNTSHDISSGETWRHHTENGLRICCINAQASKHISHKHIASIPEARLRRLPHFPKRQQLVFRRLVDLAFNGLQVTHTYTSAGSCKPMVSYFQDAGDTPSLHETRNGLSQATSYLQPWEHSELERAGCVGEEKGAHAAAEGIKTFFACSFRPTWWILWYMPPHRLSATGCRFWNSIADGGLALTVVPCAVDMY